MIRITALMDDKPSDPLCIHEHGLSYLVETPSGRFLFDCGQGENTWRNARILEKDVYDLDAVVLSHSHYDHAGGYPALVEAADGGSLLYTGEDFFQEKYTFTDHRYTSRGPGFDADFLNANGVSCETVSDVTALAEGVWLIGNFPRIYNFETIPERYVKKTEDEFVPDDFHDEICMAVDLGGKLALLVGCSHPGILNMVRRVREALDLPVYTVFGGAHLLDADPERISRTLEELEAMGIRRFGLGHCSGEGLEAVIASNPRLLACRMGAGDTLEL